MNGFGERLRALRQAQNMQQYALAEALGVSRSAVAMWERDMREPSLEMLARLAALLHVAPGALIAPSGEASVLTSVHTRRIPLLTASEPMPPVDALPLVPTADAECDYALRITDDSMAPTLTAEDTVYLRRGAPDADGQIAIVLIDARICARRLYRSGNAFTLLCDNPRHAPVTLQSPEIIGTAIACRRPLH